jgi:DNA-binding transcriptional ArsR family regulator
MTIRDPKAFEVLADGTRRKMIYLLRAKEMTVSQVAGELGLTSQAVYHQMSKLEEVGLVEVAREERVEHFIEKYYRATAEVFELQHGESGGAEAEKHYREALDALKKVGVKVPTEAGVAKKIAELHAALDKMGLPRELEEKISQIDDVDFFTKSKMYELAQMALVSDKDLDRMLAAWQSMRKVLASDTTKRAERR